jgi:hypothetical protein
MYSFEQIIENQKKYKDEIIFFLLSEIKEAKKILKEINSEDEFILKEKDKLIKKYRKFKSLESIKRYFFMSSKRDENFFVWWDTSLQEALILPYGKK